MKNKYKFVQFKDYNSLIFSIQEQVIFIHLHSFVGAKEDAPDSTDLEDIRGCPEEVVAVTENTWLVVVMAEVANNAELGDPTVAALAASWEATVRADEF